MSKEVKFVRNTRLVVKRDLFSSDPSYPHMVHVVIIVKDKTCSVILPKYLFREAKKQPHVTKSENNI